MLRHVKQWIVKNPIRKSIAESFMALSAMLVCTLIIGSVFLFVFRSFHWNMDFWWFIMGAVTMMMVNSISIEMFDGNKDDEGTPQK